MSTRRLLAVIAGAAILIAGGTAIALAAGTNGPVPPPKPLAQAIHDAAAAPPVDGITARIKFTNHLIDSSSLHGSDPILSGATGRLWLGAVALAVVSLFAWSLLAVAAWAAILVLARDGLKPALKLGLITGAVAIGFHALFALATGFDALGTLKATHQVYDIGIAGRRPYWYWLFGSPTAFLLILGVPIAWLALVRLGQAQPEALAIFAVIAIACVLGFTKAETERIWLFLAPLVILAAAPLVRRPQLIVALLAVQAVAYELVFDTLW